MSGIVPGSTKTSVSKKGGRADLASLLVHTPIHPQGRVSIDPETGLIRNPKNNVLFTKKINVKADGVTLGTRDIDVNGGHAKKEGSVWRIALAGPSYYHQMVTSDDYRYTYKGTTSRTAPELTPDEHEEYQYFRAFLAANKEVKVPLSAVHSSRDKSVHDVIDKAFYAWLQKQDKSKIELPQMQVFQQGPHAALAS